MDSQHYAVSQRRKRCAPLFAHSQTEVQNREALENRRKIMLNVTFSLRSKCLKSLGIGLLVILALALPALSQTQITTGTIQGTVTDANGAIVPGATVEIKNLETNLTKTLTTDDGGRFVALALPPGKYSVTVSKQGFATAVAESLDLTVGQALNLPVAMKVSGVAERVTI